MRQIRIIPLKNMGISLPMQVYIDRKYIGMLFKNDGAVILDEEEHELETRLVFRLFRFSFYLSGKTTIDRGEEDLTIEISDKERWWNILFNIDLVCWIVTLFFTLPSPWNLVYHILSDGFFVIWAIQIYIRRHSFFVLKKSA